jgi:CPA2 family monovalent cation:H+ antiporter-2
MRRGELGRDLSRILTQAGISHLLLESDDEEVAAARATGAPVHHGDASRPETLQAAGLEDACLVVLTFARISPARRIIKTVHRFRPTLDLVVTCSRENEISALNAFPNVYLYQILCRRYRHSETDNVASWEGGRPRCEKLIRSTTLPDSGIRIALS